MSLRDELRPITGNKLKFLLLRITEVDTKQALKFVGVKRGTYNTWLQQEQFVALYRRREEFAVDYKQEAIQMLRRDNQLEAVILEGKIVAEMKREIESKEYNLVKTNLAREVYSKLIADLDVVPKVLALSWTQRLEQAANTPNNALEEGIIDGEFKTVDGKQMEHQESPAIQSSQSGSEPAKAEERES